MAIPFLSNINMNKNEIQNLVLHTQNSDPTGTEGQIYYNSSTNKVLIHNGSSFINISGDITEVIAGNGLTGGGTVDAVTLNAVGGDGITVTANEIEATVDGVTIGLNNTNGQGALFVKDNSITGDKLSDDVTIANDLTVTGDLTVQGDTITANVGTLDVEDKNITLNFHASSDTSSTANGAGITIQDAVNATTDATILWNTSNDNFVFSHEIAVPSLDISGNVDVDGTMEADAITVNGTALNTVIENAIKARQFKANIPSTAKTAGTAFTVDHNLNSRDIIIQVYNNVTNIDGDGGNTNEIDNQYETVNVEVFRNTANQVTIKSGVALAANSLKVLITEIG
tara:strand:+ start:39 stop:1061 length:1023 start_codon:yes stop_codon:yes gene_type:complete